VRCAASSSDFRTTARKEEKPLASDVASDLTMIVKEDDDKGDDEKG
jgi:hypothetical protein